jgi:cholesterol oxidase
MSSIAEALGAEYRDNLLWLLKRVVTVHPLGGAPMGRHAGEGVVDARGEAFGHPGLYVVDGAAMPGPVGPNPALTIAAFADRVAERILESAPAATRSSNPSEPPESIGPLSASSAFVSAPAAVTTLEFTEEMKGHVTLGEADFTEGAHQGREERCALMFRLTITVSDVDGFVADPTHEATASGWLECERLGGRLPVTKGVFNLFVDGFDAGLRRMLYRLWFADSVGNPLTLVGFKTVRDDSGLDVWPDTSTLYVRVLRGHVDGWPAVAEAPAVEAANDDTVVAAGIIVIQLLDFAKQLTTFRVTGPDASSRLGALTGFGRLFLGELWNAYGGRALEAVDR